MASSSVQSSSCVVQTPFVSLTREQKRDFLSAAAVKTIQKITAGYKHRMEHYLENSHLLDIGVFYPRDYASALTNYVQQVDPAASCVAQEDLPLIQARLSTLKAQGAFVHGFLSPRHFEMKKQDGSVTGFEINSFVVKPLVRPSDALKAAYKKLSFLGCGECCQISFYQAILKALGEERFNYIFAAKGPSALFIHMNASTNPILCLIKPPHSEETPVKKADIVFFKNIDSYQQRHPNGDGAGYVTLCVDDTPGHERFTALGFGAEGLSKEEISELLREQYNKEPALVQTLSNAHAAKCILRWYKTLKRDVVEAHPQQIAHMIQTTLEKKYPRLSKEAFEEQGGMQQLKGDALGHGSLDVDKLEILARASTHEKALNMLTLWQRALLSEWTIP